MESPVVSGKTDPFRIFGAFAAVATVAVLCFILPVAWNLQLEYHDAYDNLNSARVIRNGPAENRMAYSFVRPPVTPLLYSTVVPHAVDPEKPGENLLRLPHCLSVVLSACCLLSAFLLFKQATGSVPLALLGVFLFSQNRIFLHLAPFAGADIPATLFTTTGLWLYLRAQADPESPADAWLSGVSFALAALTKFGLLGSVIPLLLAWLFLLRGQEKSSSRAFQPLVVLLVLPWLFMFVLYKIVFGLQMDATGAILDAFHDQIFVHGMHSDISESPLEYLFALLAGAGWFPVCLGAAGFISALMNRAFASRFLLLWAVSMAVMLCAAGHKEPRYLLPLLPVFYVWMLSALAAVASSAARRLRALTPVAISLVLLVLSGSALINAVPEYTGFCDTAYFRPFTDNAARAILSRISTGSSVYWYPAQSYCTITPQQAEFSDGDDYFYYYHLYANGLGWFLDRRVTPVPARGRYSGTCVFPGMLFHLKDKDVVVVTPENGVYSSTNPLEEKNRHPLAVGVVNVTRFVREEGAKDRAAVVSYSCPSTQERISFTYGPDSIRVEASRGLNGELYFPAQDGTSYIRLKCPAGAAVELPRSRYPDWREDAGTLLLAELGVQGFMAY